MVKTNNFISILISFFCFTILFITQPNIESLINYTSIKIWLSVGIGILFIYFFLLNPSGYGSITTLFITGYLIVHFQWGLMITLVEDATMLFLGFRSYEDYLPFAIWLSSLGAVCFVFGFSLINVKPINNYIRIPNLQITSVIYFLILLLTALFILVAGPSYFDGSDYSAGGMDAISGFEGYIHKILKPLVSIAIIDLVCRCISNNNFSILNLFFYYPLRMFVITLYMLIFLISGDRGEVLQPILVGLILYNYFVSKITIYKYVLIILIGSFALSLMGAARAGNTSNFAILSIADLTMNLAQSNRALLYAISDSYINGYHYGKLWISSFLSTIPGTQSILINLTDLTRFDINSSTYITFTKYGDNPHTGVGSTIVADIFLNFGTIGICFFFSLLGIFFAKMESWFHSQNPILLIISILFGSMGLFIARDTLFGPFSFIIWALVAFLIFRRLKI